MRGSVTEIYKVFDRRGQNLVIPVYQRNYDWKTAQCGRLFDDLEEVIEKKRPKHFFGAVVGDLEGSWTWVVIDGQQRLTTVSLLILALVHAIEDEDMESHDVKMARKLKGSYLLLDDDEDEGVKFKLKPVKNDNEAYRRLFGPESEYLESSNLTANYRYFRQRIRGTSLTADQLWEAVRRLEVMLLELEHQDDPQRIFESLNSTGMALSEADKIRNLVLMGQSSKEQVRLYENFWNPLERNVWYKTDWFIRWYLVTRTGATPNQHQVYEAFKKYRANSTEDISAILDHMYSYSKLVRAIQDADTGAPRIDARLRRFNPIKGDVVLPYLMPVLEDFYAGQTTEADFLNVLAILESYIFRRTTCGVATNALNKIFASLYAESRRLRTADQSYADILAYSLKRRDGSGRFPDNDEFLPAFASRNSYNLRGHYQKYLFEVLENRRSNDTRDIANALESGVISIEHIMPQSVSEAWKKELGSDWELIHRTWLHRVGNLTVTGYNTQYSNLPFQQKKTMKEGFEGSPYRINSYLRQQESWGLPQLQERTGMLTDIAREYWQYPDTTFQPPAVVLPTEPLAEGTSFRGREIVAYEYGDVKETVSSWAEMLPRMLMLLIREFRPEVMDFADGHPMFVPAENRIAPFPRGQVKVDEGLAVHVANPTDTKMRFLREIFGHLELDADELIFTLRPTKEGGNAEVGDPQESRLVPIMKFLDRFDEAASQRISPEDTRELRVQFRTEFEPFHSESPTDDMGGLTLADFNTPEGIADCTSEQILAALTLTIQSTELIDPLLLHRAIDSGVAAQWLRRLREIDSGSVVSEN